MKLKGKVTILAILALATIFTLTSCDLAGTLELDGSRTSRVVLDNGNELATLFAGQTIAAGTVEISNDADTLYITYTASGDWFLSETHLAVATSLNGIPRTKNGSPVPGQFAINESHVPTVKTVTYELPLEWAVGTTLYIGAHAVVEKYDANGQIVQQETGWSFGPRFVSKGNWATYTTYVVKQYVAPPVEEERTSETAWARLTNGFNDFLTLDFDNDGVRDFSRWGWTNGPLSEGTYIMDVYAAAGQSDITKGTLVGHLTVVYGNGIATATYAMLPGFTMTETHLFIGNAMLPLDKQGDPTVAPGSFPYKHSLDDVATDSFTVRGLSGEIHVAAHAVVWGTY